MGNLAKFGIIDGKSLPTKIVLAQNVTAMDESVTRALKSEGLMEIASSVLDSIPLTFEEVKKLLTSASLPSLMTLIGLTRSECDLISTVRPIKLLPIGWWLSTVSLAEAKTLALEFIRELKISSVDLVIDQIDLSKIEESLEVIGMLNRRRSGLRFVGPPLEELINWIEEQVSEGTIPQYLFRRSVSQASIVRARLDELLFSFKRVGIERFKHSSRIDMFKEYHILTHLREVGLKAVMVTQVDTLVDAELLTQNLLTLREMSGNEKLIDIWLPALSNRELISNPAINLLLLRTLAVGSLVLTNVPVKRASTSYFSLDALAVSRYCGASDFGYGALDKTTEDFVKVAGFETINSVLSMNLVGQVA